jgi:hypothetical protein
MSGPTGLSCGKYFPSAKFRIQVRIESIEIATKMSDNRWLISLHLPGMENGWALVTEIQNGHRMEKPEYSPNLLGDIMKQCWHIDPKERPTFSQLTEIIEKYIVSLVSFDYINGLESENDLIGETVERTEPIQHE